MAPLFRKLLRDLLSLRGQVVTVALVIAAGVASFVTLRSTLDSLERSRDSYYQRQRFAQVFASLKRAPVSLATRLANLPDIDELDARIKMPIRLPIPGEVQPALGVALSIPDEGAPQLNRLLLIQGSLPNPGADQEVVLLASYADKHGLHPGDGLQVVLEGVSHQLLIVGIAHSPEYVYPVGGGSEIVPNDERFAVVWMRRSALARAAKMEGAFNDIAATLQRGASLSAALFELDTVLAPYGGIGAQGQDRQPSNFVLAGELKQLQSLGTSVPLLFLAVASFLLNVVLSRLVLLQRTQIAVLKALGYSNRRVGLHFLEMVSVILVLGTGLGIALGMRLGQAMTGLYASVFGLPGFEYHLSWRIAGLALAVSAVAALLGAGAAVWRVVSLAPAEAMRPPAPASYRPSFFEKLGPYRIFGPSARMIAREMARAPLRSAFSIAGLSLAVGILVVGRFNLDAIDTLLHLEFSQSSREDLSVSFRNVQAERSARSIAALPGVLQAESLRSVPVRFRRGNQNRDGLLLGHPKNASLRRVVGLSKQGVELSEAGAIVTDELGRMLGLSVGDELVIKVQEGRRQQVSVPIAGFVDEKFGLQAHLPLSALNRLLDEEQGISSVLLKVDSQQQARLEERLATMSAVSDVSSRRALARRFRQQIGETVVVMTLIVSAFAATIAVGVVYNNARIALASRSRDLASLRVLGLSRGEISAILLGELGVQLLASLPFGLVLGNWMAHFIAAMAPAERIRVPVVIFPKTYAFAVLVVLAAGFASALLVRRQLDKLDLVSVLKAPE